MEKIVVAGQRRQIPAKVRGSFKNKWNRAAKLMARFDELDQKFRGMVERGGTSEHGRAALAVLLLMHTGIRVGNEASAEGYTTKPHPRSPKPPAFVQTYGLTTLRVEHVTFFGDAIEFDFLGKKQVQNCFRVVDPVLRDALRAVADTASDYSDPLLYLTDYQLTRFVKRHVGRAFSPKDFRTMRAHLVADAYIRQSFAKYYPTKKALNSDLKGLFSHVAAQLNNLPGTVKKSYLTPEWPVELAKRLAPHHFKKSQQ